MLTTLSVLKLTMGAVADYFQADERLHDFDSRQSTHKHSSTSPAPFDVLGYILVHSSHM